MRLTEATQYCVHGGLQQIKGSLAIISEIHTMSVCDTVKIFVKECYCK